MPSGRKSGPINPHFRDDDFCRAAAHAWNRLQSLEFRFVGAQAFGNLCTDPFDRRLQAIDMGPLLGDHELLMRAKMPQQCPFQFRQLLPHSPLSQVGQDDSIRGASDQGLQHRSCGSPDHIADHAGQCDIGPFQEHLAGG